MGKSCVWDIFIITCQVQWKNDREIHTDVPQKAVLFQAYLCLRSRYL